VVDILVSRAYQTEVDLPWVDIPISRACQTEVDLPWVDIPISRACQTEVDVIQCWTSLYPELVKQKLT
jgi:hypothetical protein